MAGHDEDPDATLTLQARVQEAVTAVTEAHAGADAVTIRDALNAALAARGIGEQPAPWVESTVEEIQMGRVVVTTTETQGDVDAWRGQNVTDPPVQEGRDGPV